jgi:hypothetical protein
VILIVRRMKDMPSFFHDLPAVGQHADRAFAMFFAHHAELMVLRDEVVELANELLSICQRPQRAFVAEIHGWIIVPVAAIAQIHRVPAADAAMVIGVPFVVDTTRRTRRSRQRLPRICRLYVFGFHKSFACSRRGAYGSRA